MSPSPNQLIAALKARQDIQDVLVRYCRAADRCDAALMKSCFHDDAVDDHGFFNGPASEFIDQAIPNLKERFVSTKHYLTNLYIKIDGAQARSESYILGLLRKVEDGSKFDVTFSARYLDRLERRGGLWRITHRRLVSEGSRVDRVEAEEPRLMAGRAGARGTGDPSQALFGDLTAAAKP